MECERVPGTVLLIRRTMRLSLGAVLVCITALACTAASAQAQQLWGSRGRYRVSILVPVPQQRAWRVLTNYEGLAGVLPDLKQARVLSRDGQQLVLEQTYQAPYTFGLAIKARLRLQETPQRLLSYSLIRGERLRSLSGSWSLTPIGSGVLLEHRLAVDPELPALLRSTYDELMEANLLDSMRVLKRVMLQAPGAPPQRR